MNNHIQAVPRVIFRSTASVLNGFTTGTMHFFSCLWHVVLDEHSEIASQSWIRIWRSFALQAFLFAALHTAFHRVLLPFDMWVSEKLDTGRTMDQKWLWNICFIFWLLPGLVACRVYSMKAFQVVFQKNWIVLTKAKRTRARSTSSQVESVMSVLTPGLTYWSLFGLQQAYRRPFLGPFYAIAYSLLYSFYAFNYPWTAKSVDFFTQCVRMSHNWPYFIGFSLPFTVLVNSLSINIAFGSLAFATLFPLMILAASVASNRNLETRTSAPFACYAMQPGLLASLLMIYLFSSAMNILRPLPARSQPPEQDGCRRSEAENVKCEMAKAFSHNNRTQNAAISAVSGPADSDRTSEQFDGRDDNDESAYIVIDSNLDERLVRRQ